MGTGSPASHHRKTLMHTLVILVTTVSQIMFCATAQRERVPAECTLPVRRGVKWGVGLAAPQIEGGAKAGGRKPSIWDTFARRPGQTDTKGMTLDVAGDMYTRFKSDIRILQSLGVKHYRHSISWSRLIPDGFAGSRVNLAGVKYYRDFINELRGKGIQPVITIYHWDMPQALQSAYGGWRSPRIINDFAYFAEQCFRLFGDRVKLWFTLNEPSVFCRLGYLFGTHAPGLRDQRANALCGKHALLAHAKAVRIYRAKYKPSQKGQIGMVLTTEWYEPYNPTDAQDRNAAEREIQSILGWFAEPLYNGRNGGGTTYFPVEKLSAAELRTVKGTNDFFALNHYTTRYISATRGLQLTNYRGTSVGGSTGHPWFYVAPWGFEKLLYYINARYVRPARQALLVTESGVSISGERYKTSGFNNDPQRTAFYQGYIGAACRAIRGGVPVKMYLAWAFMDNFEWEYAYTVPMGLVHVDYRARGAKYLRRTVKNSALWLRDNFFRVSA